MKVVTISLIFNIHTKPLGPRDQSRSAFPKKPLYDSSLEKTIRDALKNKDWGHPCFNHPAAYDVLCSLKNRKRVKDELKVEPYYSRVEIRLVKTIRSILRD